MNQTELNADTLFAFQMALKGHKQFEWKSINSGWLKTDRVTSGAPHRIFHDIPEGWTRHDGEDWKGDKDAVIEEVMFCNGYKTEANKAASYYSSAGYFKHDSPHHRIYAYKLAANSPAIPEGFTAWNGGKNPLTKGEKCEWVLRDGSRIMNDFGTDEVWLWYHNSRDIIAYRVIEKKVIPWTMETCPQLPFEVKCKRTGNRHSLVAVVNGSNFFIDGESWRSGEHMLNYFTKGDGSPCGKEVEQ